MQGGLKLFYKFNSPVNGGWDSFHGGLTSDIPIMFAGGVEVIDVYDPNAFLKVN